MTRFKSLVVATTLGFAAAGFGAVGNSAAAEQEKSEVANACRADVEKLCKGVKPGEGGLIKCLKEHEADVSKGCKDALKAARSERKAQ